MKLLCKPSWGWRHPGVVKIRTLMIPALFGVSVSQINLLLDTLIASFLVTGSISWLYYSDRLLEFPLGLFGIAIATVILPSLSQRHVDKSPQQFQQTMDWAVRMVCFLGIPAAIGLAMLGQPILQVLFMRGAFDQQDVLNASYSLMAYSGGLLFFMLVKVLAPGYYSRQDTKTPVKIGIIAMLSNMGFNFIFAIPYGYVGLAIATALSALLNASLLYRGLYRQGVYRLSSATLLCIAKIVVASLLMGGLIGYLSPSANEWFDLTWSQSVLQLIICIFAAFLGYLILLFGLGIRLAHLKSSFGAVTGD